MPQNRRKEIVARRAKISRLYLQGMTGMEIARKVKISESQISRDLKAISRFWMESATRDIAQRKSQDLQELNLIKRELWQSWHESKSEKGDPRYMSELLKALKQSAELLGLNSPAKSSIDLNIEKILEMAPPEIVDLLFDRIMEIQKDNE